MNRAEHFVFAQLKVIDALRRYHVELNVFHRQQPQIGGAQADLSALLLIFADQYSHRVDGIEVAEEFGMFELKVDIRLGHLRIAGNAAGCERFRGGQRALSAVHII